MTRIVIAIIILLAMSWALSIANGVTFTDQQLQVLEERMNKYDGPIKIGASEQQQSLVRYAWEISRNFDFILTVEKESGFTATAVGDRGKAFGLCQRRRDYGRGRLLDDPRFKDPKFQLDSCWNSYKIRETNGKLRNRLYGYNSRNSVKNRFSF